MIKLWLVTIDRMKSVNANLRGLPGQQVKILYCGKYRIFWPVTTRDVSYIKKIVLFARRSDITTPPPTNSAHRAPDMAGVQCYFGSFFIYKYNWNYFYHASAWFWLILYGYLIIRLLLYKYNILFYDHVHVLEAHYLASSVMHPRHDLGHEMLYLYNNLQLYSTPPWNGARTCKVSRKYRIWIYWIFYDHLSVHSLLAKLGWWGWLMRMRLAWKKSQNTLDTSKRLHQNKTWSTGSAGKGLDPNFDIFGTADSGKVQVCHAWRHLAGVWNIPARWHLQLGL